MNTPANSSVYRDDLGVKLLDFSPPEENQRDELLKGLSKLQKEIHPKFLYDAHGSELFEKICVLDEYYPTRTEISILHEFMPQIASQIGPHSALIEFGSGSSIKTKILLKSLNQLAAYVPIDISKDFLLDSAQQTKKDFPQLNIRPIAADYTLPLLIPPQSLNEAVRKVAFFPGSTLGNFEPQEAKTFLLNVVKLLETRGLFLLGIDLIKDRGQLERAYNDSEGITAAFNLNVLNRINREFDANFDLRTFSHRAFFNAEKSRIEMHLVSLKDQIIKIAGKTVAFRQSETIHTENSYKFNPQQFEDFIESVGFSKLQLWTDLRKLFAVYLLEVKAK